MHDLRYIFSSFALSIQTMFFNLAHNMVLVENNGQDVEDITLIVVGDLEKVLPLILCPLHHGNGASDSGLCDQVSNVNSPQPRLLLRDP